MNGANLSPGVEAGQPEVDCVSAVGDGCTNALPVSCGSEQFGWLGGHLASIA